MPRGEAVRAFVAPAVIASDGERPWLYGVWRQASFAVKSGYYGGYPGDYLKRIKASFPDRQHVLHVFSGMVDTAMMPGDTLDIRPELAPTYCIECAGTGVRPDHRRLAAAAADEADAETAAVTSGAVTRAGYRSGRSLGSGALRSWDLRRTSSGTRDTAASACRVAGPMVGR
jgi:hypothetical protein